MHRQESTERAAEELAWLARIPQENPDPVVRVSAEHVLLYSNPAGEELCRAWGCHLGQKVPTAVGALISAALAEGAMTRHKVAFGSRIYGLTVAPAVADGCVNIYARDITDCKRAQEALRQAEQRFQAIFDNTSDGIFLLDLETRTFTMCNNACARMLGYTQDEFVNLRIPDLHLPPDLPFIDAQIEEFVKGRRGTRHDIRFKRKDGSLLFVDLSPDLVRLNGKRYIVVALKDITERKRMEEELRQHTEHLEELVAARTREVQESERRYRSLAENAPDIIQRLDRDLRHLYVNPAFEHATGLSSQTVIGRTDRELALPPDLIPFWEQAVRTVFRTGESQILVFEMPTPRGPRHFEAHLVPEFAPEGAVEHLLAITRDITERKRAEDALRESEERFRTAFEESAVPMALTALDSTLLKVNAAFCRMLGFNESELVGRSYTEITHPEDIAANLVGTRQLARGEISSFRLEKRYLRKDGAIIWGNMHTAAVHDDRGRPLYCVTHVQDVTHRRQAEEALRRLNGRLELQVAQRTEELRHTVDRLQQLTLELSQAEDRERQRIADILHDDVQQTLAAAKFHLNLLSSEPRSAAESREIVAQVMQMLKDAIEKSRRLSHELSPALYQVDLTAILEWLARHMQEKHGLTVRVEAHGPVDSSSEPLKAFLCKVAQELLFNVVKHAGVSAAGIRVRRIGPRIYLSVVDQGRGFDPQSLAGTAGVGLLSIRERVQLLGGRMKIHSTPGRGSRFLIAVPDEAIARGAVPAEGPAPQGQPETAAHDRSVEPP